ncbi:Oligo-1,6-glucosidase [Acholeplasma oculi]|uniref:Putative oligo-1,6-glucosidase n=1 Tax=Acholeplasma oculi TaxID=35623 RepID=A0A061AGV1_9MOLU|nr:alpha-glucosidase [Acholeplasma oculi]CDR30801.1 putative oligo-1,6-glucosidase [Acholeplasma oculi]SKC35030.1 oligo-1,6-glucosidase [Acholeplasma oculi]SUT89775.1 Oligo-1,6-glucosidase [Acholeplasma oculi]
MKHWWMESVGYQIYIKSFFDSNNDGIGDINGITEKLDYLHLLGVNLIWITPFYDSPMDDNGYDVRDYYKVSNMYGTIDDFERLIEKAKSLGIKVILDFVLNHTSDEHPWFVESRKSRNNPFRDYYIWQDPKYVNGKRLEPTNWGSFFGGSAWKYDEATNQYYMKIFSDKMPDLNWKNPKVMDSMINVGKFWLELGVDGFRMDAVSHLERAPFIDSAFSKDIVLDWFKFSNLEGNHTYLKELNEKLFKPYGAFTIGEVGGEASIDEAIKYSSFTSNEMSMVFNFDHNWKNNVFDITDLKDLKVDVIGLKKVLSKWQETFKTIGWLPLNWLNHDQPRVVSHYGSMDYHSESAKMLATIMYMSRGTPFIYQGEEIGMTNYPFKSMDEINDVSTINSYHNQIKDRPNDKEMILKKSLMTTRDHPRTIMQWSSQKNAGFSQNKPWFHVNPNFIEINVSKQLSDPNSIFAHYQKLISLRRFSNYKETILYGDYQMILQDHPTIFSYIRKGPQKLVIIGSFSKDNETFDTNNLKFKKLVLSNYKDVILVNNKITLRPYEAIVYEVEESL